jgi:hypothetical protein
MNFCKIFITGKVRVGRFEKPAASWEALSARNGSAIMVYLPFWGKGVRLLALNENELGSNRRNVKLRVRREPHPTIKRFGASHEKVEAWWLFEWREKP